MQSFLHNFIIYLGLIYYYKCKYRIIDLSLEYLCYYMIVRISGSKNSQTKLKINELTFLKFDFIFVK